jgi:hypothetical protein
MPDEICEVCNCDFDEAGRCLCDTKYRWASKRYGKSEAEEVAEEDTEDAENS